MITVLFGQIRQEDSAPSRWILLFVVRKGEKRK